MMDLWYKNAIIYAIDVGTFQDGNGDGMGDFSGLISRLDYLSELGVTCLWLLPFYPSPGRDNGYDVSNYEGVDSRKGTLEEFIACVHGAGERGMRVIVDLVVDHTSNEHPWFQAARRDPDSRFRDYYVWTRTPPAIPQDRKNIFPDQEHSVWTYDELAGAYYYHRFYRFEPDLDASHPAVREEIKRVIDLWLAFGVSGFRVDAASHLIENEHPEYSHPSDPHVILKELSAFARARRPDIALIGEADVEGRELRAYFGEGDELQMLYNFLLSNELFLALATGRAAPLERVWRQLPRLPETGQWANFLRNLDELDLERLGAHEREQVYQAFAPQPEMRIFGRGVRRRLAPMLPDRRQWEMALSLLFSMPGAPVLVYGDEIGMGEDLALEGRSAVRTPMQWSDAEHGGFSSAKPEQLVRPVVATGPYGFTEVNVARQQDDPRSRLKWMKRLIEVRRACPEWGCGEIDVIRTSPASVFAHRCRWRGGEVLAVHNLADSEAKVSIDIGQRVGRVGSLFSSNGDQGDHEDLRDGRLTLEGFGYRWYRISES